MKCATQPDVENSADITLPDVVGRNAKAASEQLNQLGLLNVQLSSANPSYAMVLVAANWTVVSTNPAPCSVITRHDHVALHVTKPGRGLGSVLEFPWSH
jgi:beta-lactam-binding protein with PASTA domain